MKTTAKSWILRPYLISAHWIVEESTILVTDTFCVLTSVIRSLYHSETFEINYRPISTTLASLVENACRVQRVYFRENPSNGGRDTDQKVRCSSCSAPLTTDLSQKLTSLAAHACVPDYNIFMKIPQWNPRYRPKGTLLFMFSAIN